MPVPSTPGTTEYTFSATIIDAAGRQGVTSISSENQITTSIAANLVLALGRMTNGAIIADRLTVQNYDNPISRRVFDESYSSITTKATFVFQDSLRKIVRVEVPAPDASIFGSDGNTVDPDNALVEALVDEVLAVLGGTYVLVRGFLSSRTRQPKGATNPPTIVEPGATSVPGDAPGTTTDA